MEEIVSVAVFESQPGHDGECLATLRQLDGILTAKHYSRDVLYRHNADPRRYILVRRWASPQARREAIEDPAAQKCWARLGHLTKILKIYETLEEVRL